MRVELACGARVCARLADGYQVGLWSPPREHDELGGHWSFARASTGALRWYLRGEAPPFRAASTTQVALAGIPATVHRMPRTVPAFYAGHVVVTWRQSGDDFHLSIHGWRNEAAARVMAAALIRKAARGS